LLSIRPSELLGFTDDIEAFYFDLLVLAKDQSLSGRVRQKTLDVLRRLGSWR